MGIAIKIVHEVEGNIQVAARCESSKAGELVKADEEKTGMTATLTTREKAFFIFNIEDETNEEDVQNEVRRITGTTNKGEVRVLFRTSKGLMSALVIADEETANKMIRERTVRRAVG